MKNLYGILEVPVTASKAEIKRNYYQKAKKSHPDKVTYDKVEEAGTEFKELAKAYQILINDVHRAAYDKGEDPDKILGKNENAEIFSAAVQMFMEIVGRTRLEDLPGTNVFEEMLKMVDAVQNNTRQVLELKIEELEKWKSVAARIKVRTGENVFLGVIEGRVEVGHREIAAINADLEKGKKIKLFVQNYVWDVKEGALPSKRVLRW